jgi:hypothetical protein
MVRFLIALLLQPCIALSLLYIHSSIALAAAYLNLQLYSSMKDKPLSVHDDNAVCVHVCVNNNQQPTNQPTKQHTNQSTTIQPTNQPETWVVWGPLYLCKIIRYSPLNKSAEPEP